MLYLIGDLVRTMDKMQPTDSDEQVMQTTSEFSAFIVIAVPVIVTIVFLLILLHKRRKRKRLDKVQLDILAV